MKKKLLSPYLFFILIYILLFIFSFSSTPVLQQDGVFKYYQLEDFANSQGWDFSSPDPSREFDEGGKYSRFKEPFMYQLSGKKFFVFPYFWTLLNYLPFKVFGYYGIYLFSFLFGLLSLYSFRKLLLHVFQGESSFVDYASWFYVLSTPLVIYSLWFYEATLCSFLLYEGLYLLLEKGKKLYYASISGILLGLLIYLRAEVLFYACAFLGLLFYKIPEYRKSLFLLGFVLGLFVLGSFFMNHSIYGIYSPLRALEVSSYSLLDRFERVGEYLFLEHYSILFYFPLGYYSLRFLSEEYNRERKLGDKEMILLVSVWFFILFLPFVVLNQQGSDLTPRFFFPVLTLLASIVLKGFQIQWSPKKSLWASRFLVAYSSTFILVMAVVHISVTKLTEKMLQAYTQESGELNIFTDIFASNTLIVDRNKKYVLVQNGYFLGKYLNSISEKKMAEKVRIFKHPANKIRIDNLPIRKVADYPGIVEVYELSSL